MLWWKTDRRDITFKFFLTFEKAYSCDMVRKKENENVQRYVLPHTAITATPGLYTVHLYNPYTIEALARVPVWKWCNAFCLKPSECIRKGGGGARGVTSPTAWNQLCISGSVHAAEAPIQQASRFPEGHLLFTAAFADSMTIRDWFANSITIELLEGFEQRQGCRFTMQNMFG